MYLSLIGDGTPAPFEVTRWRLVERFGWTLAEVDGMTMADLHELYQVDDGIGKARQFGKGGK